MVSPVLFGSFICFDRYWAIVILADVFDSRVICRYILCSPFMSDLCWHHKEEVFSLCRLRLQGLL